VSAVAFQTPELYRRFKSLAVAARAALILGERIDELQPVADELHRDAAGTSCEEPAARLRQLVHGALSGEVIDAELDALRTSHRSLRREVWTTEPCEYVPCCAGTNHHR
jgi:hypothetical protein